MFFSFLFLSGWLMLTFPMEVGDSYMKALFQHVIQRTLLLILAPLFYFFVKLLSGRYNGMKKSSWLWWLPSMLYAGYYLVQVRVSPNEILERGWWMSPKVGFLMDLSLMGWSIVFLMRSCPVLKIKHEFPRLLLWNNPLDSLVWSSVFLIFLLSLFLSFFRWMAPSVDFYLQPIVVGVVAMVVVLCLFVIHLRDGLILEEMPVATDESSKALEVVLSPASDVLNEVYSKVNAFMANHQCFLDGELTLRKLSEQSQIPQHQISQAINAYAGKTFPEYINGFRINYFLEQLKEANHMKLTIVGLAMESGFNSKASFNRVFKQMTGTTPTEYINGMGQGEAKA